MNYKSHSTYFHAANDIIDFSTAIPEYSQIIDIVMTSDGVIKTLYTNTYSNTKKDIHVKIVKSTLEEFYVPDNYQFYKSCILTDPDLNIVSGGKNVNMNIVNIINIFYIFVYEIPTIAEVRDKKIKEII
jgi:hypothetical protein